MEKVMQVQIGYLYTGVKYNKTEFSFMGELF